MGFCLFNHPYRRVFTSVWLVWGVIAFMVTLFPLWYWNWQHDWISFTFQLSGRFQSPEGGSSFSFNPLGIIFVALVSCGYLFPSFGFPLWWISGKFTYGQWINLPNYQIRLILWICLPLTFGFTFLGAFTHILPTWAMPGFWGLTLLLGNYIANCDRSTLSLRRWLVFSGLFINSIFLVGLLHLNLGILQKPNQTQFFTGIIPPENDPSTELIDIMQLRNNFQSSSVLTNALKEVDFVFTNQYYLGGYIAMSLAPLTDLPITCFGYDSRGFTYWYPQEKLIGKKGLYITSETFAKDEYSQHDYSGYFESWQEVTSILIKRSGEVTETFYVFQGEGLKFINEKLG